MKKLSKEEIIILIKKLQNAEGSDEEQSNWVWRIQNSVPFYGDIYNLLFFSDEILTAEELYKRAEENYKPIIL